MSAKIPALTYAVQIVPWTSDINYSGLLLGSELLCTKNLGTVTNKATEFFVTASPYSLETPHFHRKPNQHSINCSSDPFSLTPPLSGVATVTETASNKSSTTRAYE
jgi:hypothetical protein